MKILNFLLAALMVLFILYLFSLTLSFESEESQNDARASVQLLTESAEVMNEADLSVDEKIQNQKLMLIFNKLALVNREQAIHNESDARRYRFTVFGLCLASLLIFGTLVVFGKVRNRQHALVNEQQQLRISILRLQNIRNRITPHFIFNELNRVISQASDKGQYNEMQDLVKLLRFSLQLNQKLGITLKEELDFVRFYLEVERKRLGDDFVVEWVLDEAVNPDEVFLPAMFVQIPVENAIKHGLALLEGEKRLRICVSGQTGGVKVCVSDNGLGFYPDLELGVYGTGMGLKVLYQTADVLNGMNKEKLTISVDNRKDGGGTEVCFFIPDNYKIE
ncbi:MAG: histidine kinase [Tannerellaceae bacterium]|nr:histidine kinase [Tannerellaceae bacterium]